VPIPKAPSAHKENGKTMRSIYSNRCFLLLIIFTISGNARSESGQQCSAMTLQQSYTSWHSSMEKFVPIPSFVYSIDSCVKPKKMGLANYSPLCEISPGVEVPLAIVFGPSKANGLLSSVNYIPYSDQSVALVQQLAGSRSNTALENSPAFMKDTIARAAEAVLIEEREIDTWLLITKEKGIAALSDKDFTVLRLYSISEFGEFYDSLMKCQKD
jgi:hypothetical protein